MDPEEENEPINTNADTISSSINDTIARASEEDIGATNEPAAARSLDDFLEEAHAASECLRQQQRGRQLPWGYWIMFVSLGVANSSDATEILCLSYILSEPSFQETMLKPHDDNGNTFGAAASLVAATVFFGMLLGGLGVGVLGDRRGRRPMLLAGLATNGVAGFLSSACASIYQLALLRFAAGLGIGATVPPLFSLCSELAVRQERGFWVSVAASFWMVGSIYVALAGLWILAPAQEQQEDPSGASWRIFAAVCALPSAIGCIAVYLFVPESPRFLALRGKYVQACAVAQQLADAMHFAGTPLSPEELHQHCEGGNDDIEDNNSVYSHEQESGGRRNDFAILQENMSEEDDLTTSRENQTVLSSAVPRVCRDFLKASSSLLCTNNAQLRSQTYTLLLIWFALNFGSYGLMTWINTLFVAVHLKNVYFNALLFAASNLPGNLLSALLIDRIGRGRLLIGSICAAATSLVAFAYVATIVDTTNATTATTPSISVCIVLAACSFQCFTISAWNAIDVMTSELFPTSVRSTGTGICAASGRVGAMVAQIVNGWLVAHPARLLLTAAGTLATGALAAPYLPDKSGQAVEDVVAGSYSNGFGYDDNNNNASLDGYLLPSRRSSTSNSHQRRRRVRSLDL